MSPSTRLSEIDFLKCKLLGVNWVSAAWPTFKTSAELTFTECNLSESSMFGLKFHELLLNECKAHNVDFREAELCNAQLTTSDFMSSLFSHTDLSRVDFSGSININLDLLNNTVSGCKIPQIEALSLLHYLDIEVVD